MFFFRSKKLIVSQGESGCYQSISEAIHDASPDATILVRRGIYQESIIIDKPLTIIGDGLRRDIVITGTDKNCITMQTHLSEIKNLTIRHPFSYGNAVYIPQGELMLEDCEIASEWVGVFIQGQKNNPTIRQCKINGGLCFGNETQGIVEGCDITTNNHPGVTIGQDANPKISGCKIHDGQNTGIWVNNKGQGTIEDCDIFANTPVAIGITNGGNPTIRKCKIHDGRIGIWVKDNGQGTIEDCDIFANAYPGISIDNGGNPTIRKCQIHDAQSNGIRVTDNGQGTIEDCDIFTNASIGIYLDDRSNLRVHNCNIFDNKRQHWYIANDCIVSGYIENKENKNSKNNTISENISSEKSKKELTKESKEQNPNRTIKSHNSRLELLLYQLETMIGLDSVKEAVLEIVNTEIANQRLKKEGHEVEESETRHMLFSGNPGTGKTTIARLIGEIFKELGILQKGEFIEVQRDSLVAIYLGQTASKTTELVESALDSVLFIDEAYSLANGLHDEYGREAINTLIALMENYRHRLVVIFAGYSNEMKSFLNSNSGLKSRIAFHIDFPDYTGEEMHSIFLTMCNNNKTGWICTENVSERLKTIFINMYENRGNNFANGRDVRNIFEKMVRRIKTRIVRENLSGKSMRTFSLNDIPPELQ